MITVTNHLKRFDSLERGTPFAAHITIYSRSDGKEQPREHLFYKIGRNRAVTIDKKIYVHFLSGFFVAICIN
jgi:hypothetical protein